MKKILLLLIFLSFFTKTFAQLDTDHWFAPMVDRTGLDYSMQRIYMSTNETVPFTVNIYSNKTVIGTVTISKNSPQFYNISNRGYIAVTPADASSSVDLFKPVKRGIYLKGEKPFYASLRFSVNNHAEILTSKGMAGLGKDFRVVMAPILAENEILNFMTSVIATQDNTNVTISGFDPNLKFSDGVSRLQFNFTLNKGESYIIDGTGDKTENRKGLIGAKITSDKPISITNGNFNGQYAGSYLNASDILMDQGVPEDKLGKTFVLVKGNGSNSFVDGTSSQTTMEKAIIVAVKDNTQIYLNDSTTPAAVLQSGEFFETPPDSYKSQGSDHYNMFISANNDIYVYQLLAGIANGDPITNANGQATGGFNYIPPLSCYLPKKIDEIGFIDQNRVYISSIGGYRDNISTKLNIITERGAVIDIKRNGVSLNLVAANGPFDVTGNNSWVTYSVPNITGNVAIFSSKAVTAGISAGDAAVGYGGYFAGFSFIPAIIEQSGCLPNAVLTLTEGFDKYKWMYRDNDGNESVVKDVSGTVAGANIINPTKVGYYWAVVQQGSCNEVSTAEVKILNCVDHTSQSYDVCDQLLIAPVQFSLGNQSVLSITETEKPKKGTLVIDNAAKTLTYIPNPGEQGTDFFKYEIKGNGAVPDSEVVWVTVNLNVLAATDDKVNGCKVNSTTGEFDLRKAKVTTDAAATQTFYKFKPDADGNTGLNVIQPADFPKYLSAEGAIYVRVSKAACAKTVKIDLKYYPDAELINNVYADCENVLKEKVEVKLSQVAQQLLKDPAYFKTFKFYLNGSPLVADDWSYSADTVLQLEVESPDGCATKSFPVTFKIKPKTPLTAIKKTVEVCDDDLDGIKIIENPNDFNNLFTADPSVTAKFYLTKNDTEPLTKLTVDKEKTYFVVIANGADCPSLAELTIKIIVPSKSDILQDKTICSEDQVSLDAGPGFIKTEWYKEESPTTPFWTEPETEELPVGKYYVILTSPNGCSYRQNVEIKAFELPTIEGIEIVGSTVTITATGGTKPYRYGIDGNNYQDSNVFTNVAPGLHKAYVISADNCDSVEKEFSVIEIFNLISPNGDGVNDVLDMSLLKYKIEPKFEIISRQGQKLFEGNSTNNFIWDGKQNGKPLPTSSYWYLIEWRDFENSTPIKYSGWVLLKNRNTQ